MRRTIEHRKNATIADMRPYFDCPLKEAAMRLNMSHSLLKRLCREQGISRWPFRKVSKTYSFTHRVDLFTHGGNSKFEIQTERSTFRPSTTYSETD